MNPDAHTEARVRVLAPLLGQPLSEHELRFLAHKIDGEFRPSGVAREIDRRPCVRCGVRADRHAFAGCNVWRAA